MRSTYLCHDTTRTHCTATSDCHARTHGHIPTDPNILLDNDRLSRLWTIRSIPQLRIERVSARIQAYIRSQQSSRADGNKTSVDDGAVDVYKDAFS
jgi:hypothetical protein